MNSISEYENMPDIRGVPHFDYRMHDYPYPHNPHKSDLDYSVSTFTGFECLQTNIRSYFSPLETTGQRYIYTGSSDGWVYIYDILSGENKCCIETPNRNVIRDVAWHPSVPLIASTSFRGEINFFQFDDAEEYQPKNIRNTKSRDNYRDIFNRLF